VVVGERAGAGVEEGGEKRSLGTEAGSLAAVLMPTLSSSWHPSEPQPKPAARRHAPPKPPKRAVRDITNASCDPRSQSARQTAVPTAHQEPQASDEW
jgi:hypothetical protein